MLLLKHKIVWLAWRLPNLFNVLSQRNNRIKLTHYDETKERTHDSQIVRAKENHKLSYGGPSKQQALGTNQRIKALCQGRHWVWGLTHRRVIKEETIAINRDLVLQPGMHTVT